MDISDARERRAELVLKRGLKVEICVFEMRAENRVGSQQGKSVTREDQGGLGRPRNVSLGRSLEWRPFPWHSQARRENKVVSPDKEESDSDYLSREEGGGQRSPRSFPYRTSTSETRFGVSGFPSPSSCRRKF